MASRDNGIDESLAITEASTIESVRSHFKCLIQNDEVVVDCLFTGNVSSSEAKEFFSQAASYVANARNGTIPETENKNELWIPGKRQTLRMTYE